MQFKSSAFLSLGLELELQIINKESFDLMPRAYEFIKNFTDNSFNSQLKPEITQSMIEINSSVHQHPNTLLSELRNIRDSLLLNADELDVNLMGGGTHHFQMWHDRKIYPHAHYKMAAKRYGYLAKMFTVFGMHIHIGCPSADDAMYLMNVLSRYIPHFIALSASSPFCQGVDTFFDSSRNNVVNMFPLSGLPPSVSSWENFCLWLDNIKILGIANSINSFYWDIRPKPEYGTIEIRVCDAPLTLERAVEIAAYAQTLARYIFLERPYPQIYHDPLIYNFNRYESSYNSFQALFTNPYSMQQQGLKQDMLDTIQCLEIHSKALDNQSYLESIKSLVQNESNDANILRKHFQEHNSLEQLVKWQSLLFAGHNATKTIQHSFEADRILE